MAFAPKRLCSCGRYAVSRGEACPCRPHQKAENDKHRPDRHARGYTSDWYRERAEFLKEHRHCIRCGEPATVVDHTIPHKGDMGLFWNRGNWQPLCRRCHNGWKKAQEMRQVAR